MRTHARTRSDSRALLSRLLIGTALTAALLVGLVSGCSGGGGSSIASGFPAGNSFNNSGGGGGGSSSGVGSVRVQVPFDGGSGARLQVTFPSNVDHVECQLFGPNMGSPALRSVNRSSPFAVFPDVPAGEKWLLAVAVESTSTFFPGAPAQTTSNQRVLNQTLPAIFSMGLSRIQVQAGTENNVLVQTFPAIPGVGTWNQTTIGGTTGMILNITGEQGRDFFTADDTGLYINGQAGNDNITLFEDNTPRSLQLPLPLSDTSTRSQTYTIRNLSGNTPQVIDNCDEQVRVVGVENIVSPLYSGPAVHVRRTEICRFASNNQVSEEFVSDFWYVEGFGLILNASTGGTGASGLFQRRISGSGAKAQSVARRQTSGSFVFAEDMLLVVARSVGTLAGDAFGNHFGIGNGTQWTVLSVSAPETNL